MKSKKSESIAPVVTLSAAPTAFGEESPTAATKVKKTYSYFSLETLEDVSEEVEVEFVPAATVEDAQQRLGGASILDALNAALRRQTFFNAEQAVKAKGVSSSALYAMIRNFRQFPPYSTMIPTTKTEGESDADFNARVKAGRDTQTKALIEFVKNTPSFLDMLKSATAAEQAEG